MTRRALPFLMVAAAITAASGCTCSGDVSKFPLVGTGPGADGGPNGNPDGGGGDGGGQNVTDPCKVIVCPPPADGGFSGTIDFPPDGGFSLDGGVGTSGDGVSVDPLGRITLNNQDIEINFAWIANWKMGTVSKFDTKNLLPDGGIHEVGRYVSVFPLDGLGRRNHSSSASVYDPSRTAIDINGDMWVANFASHANQYFSVSKVAGSLFNCVDRNGNGKIDTSADDPADVANYGVITPNEYLNPSDPNNPLLYDECVLFTQELGNINPNGAFGEGSISIAAAPEGGPGDVWVGTWIDRRMWRLDPFTGVPKAIPAGTNVGSLPDGGGQYISIPSIEPYGSAVDAKNRLWVAHRVQNTVAVIDTNTASLLAGAISPPTGIPRGGYGIAVDKQGRVWVPNWGSGPTATRYTPPTGGPIDAGTWDVFDFSALSSPSGTKIGQGRGVTVDDDGFVWFSGDRNNLGSAALVWGADINDGGVRMFPSAGTPTGLIDATSTWSKTSIGIGLDQNKNLWINNSTGNVMRIDRATGGVTTSANQAGALYTYSDFTGYQLRHITLNQGSFSQTVSGCSRYAEWDTVTWNAITPPNTSVVLFVRGSNNLDFTVSQEYGPFNSSPANLQAAPGPVPQFKYLLLKFLLTSKDGTSQPYLLSFNVTSKCLTPLQ
jgi:streptogramin lyase